MRINLDLKGNYVPTSQEVDYMVTEEIRSAYSPSQETKILRLYLADPVANKVAFDTYNAFVEAARAKATKVRSDALLLQSAINYESAESRLTHIELSVGRPEQIIETPTGEIDPDGKPVVIITVIPAIPSVAANVDVTDEFGVVTTVPNPVVVKDEAERITATNIIAAAPQTVLDLVALRK